MDDVVVTKTKKVVAAACFEEICMKVVLLVFVKLEKQPVILLEKYRCMLRQGALAAGLS